ncbi:hypothetical protein ZIOFF_002815 [Zingiber officinale]|uniref:BED-type domain-containing protein n=1 Tax=Zingiber officinale TaxID=94328 RepID=A0A8J5M9M8_ZINOF|nr:hypothetical protein ZIOFF_002815 [Zingiber officinale]
MNPVDPTTENEVPLSNVNHEVPQISEVNNEVPQDQPNMTSVAADASSSTDATPSAIGTRKLTSDVWNHFRRKKINGMDKAICNYCEKSLSGNSKYGTTHLREHFKICPRQTVSDIRQKILIKEKNKRDFVIKGFQFDQEVSRCMLAEMIILHEYPLTIVEHHGFRKLLASLQPLFKVPCRNTIKSDILKLYDYEKTKVLSLLECNRATSSQETKAYYSSVEYDEDTIDVDGLEMVDECLSQDMDMSGLLLLYSSPDVALMASVGLGFVKLAFTITKCTFADRKVKMGHGVICGGGQSSLGYLFGSGEAPKSAGESAEPVQKPAFKSTGEPAEPLQKPTPATQVDNKHIPTGTPFNEGASYSGRRLFPWFPVCVKVNPKATDSLGDPEEVRRRPSPGTMRALLFLFLSLLHRLFPSLDSSPSLFSADINNSRSIPSPSSSLILRHPLPSDPLVLPSIGATQPLPTICLRLTDNAAAVEGGDVVGLSEDPDSSSSRSSSRSDRTGAT